MEFWKFKRLPKGLWNLLSSCFLVSESLFILSNIISNKEKLNMHCVPGSTGGWTASDWSTSKQRYLMPRKSGSDFFFIWDTTIEEAESLISVLVHPENKHNQQQVFSTTNPFISSYDFLQFVSHLKETTSCEEF